MSDTSSSMILACLAIIIAAILIASVYVISSSLTDTGNTIVSQADEDVIQERQTRYQRYDGEEITGGNLINLIKESYSVDDDIEIIVQSGTDSISFTSGSATPADRLNNAKSIINADTIYKGQGVYTRNGVLYRIVFTAVTA